MRSPLRLAILAAILAAPTAGAQTSDATSQLIQRIWTLGMDSSQVEPLAQVLLDSIGPRLTGTPHQRRGNEWLARTYASWGVEARNEQWGTWRGWRRGHSHIDLIAPRVRTLEATMLGYSPGTGGRDVTAETIILPHFPDSMAFETWLPNVRGKLVLVAPPQPTCRPTADWQEYATPDSKARMDTLRAQVRTEWQQRVRATGFSLALGTGSLGLRLEAAGAAGVLTSRPKDGWGTIEVFETYNTTAPAIGLSCEDYGLVFRLTENGQHPRIRMNLDAELLGEQPVFNTIATIPGTERPDEYVVLSAHFDSWDGSSGATDNGTGTITMLEAMRILRTALPNPKRTILVGHWAAEENGLVGSRAFAEDHPEVVSGLQALFNQDNGTGRVVRTSAGGLPNAAEHYAQWIAQLPEIFQEQMSFGGVGFPAVGGSDHAAFACHGAPAFGISSLSWNYFTYTWHTNRDTYDKIAFDDLRKNATLTAMLAYLASEDPTTITRERVDLAALAAQQSAAGGGNRRFRAPTSWPECSPAPRSTSPRLR